MVIRSITATDEDALWALLEPVIRAGDTFALPRDMTRGAAVAYWCAPQHDVLVADLDGDLVGSYFLRPNQLGGGSHVANAGYVTATHATGRGIARAMCVHSIERARARYRAMQFDLVVATNERAVRLWEGMGFSIVGRLPGAFEHPTHGFVDALVMYQSLAG
jgi:ribosomal protein S18 acetylase RimI-like enzyme